MLSNIKAKIEEVEDLSFAQFFQEYVMTMQDIIINKHIRAIASQVKNIEDLTDVDNAVSVICENMLEETRND